MADNPHEYWVSLSEFDQVPPYVPPTDNQGYVDGYETLSRPVLKTYTIGMLGVGAHRILTTCAHPNLTRG